MKALWSIPELHQSPRWKKTLYSIHCWYIIRVLIPWYKNAMRVGSFSGVSTLRAIMSARLILGHVSSSQFTQLTPVIHVVELSPDILDLSSKLFSFSFSWTSNRQQNTLQWPILILCSFTIAIQLSVVQKILLYWCL